MYLRTYVDVSLDFEEVRAGMLRDRPPSCLDGAAEAAEKACADLLARAGLRTYWRLPTWPTAVEAAAPITTDRLASLPLCLHAGQAVLSRLATLDAGWLGAGRTHLSLSMTYDTPPDSARGHDVLSQFRDRALLHRVYEAVALRYLDSVAENLMAQAALLTAPRVLSNG